MKLKQHVALINLAAIFLFSSLSSSQAQTELIVNGGFESGTTGWTFSGGASPDSSVGYARTGSSFLFLGGLEDEVDEAYQTVVIPGTASLATLSFYYNIQSEDDFSTIYDTFSVTIRNTSGTILATVTNLSNVNQDSGSGSAHYHQKTFNLLPYAGQTVRVYFDSANDPSLTTSFLVDDVSVLVAAVVPDLTKLTDNLNNLNPNSGDLVTVALTITNQACSGNGTNAGPFHVGYYWSSSSSFTGVTPFYEAAVAGCAKNGTVAVSHDVVIDPAIPSGTYYLGYKIDDNNEVAECVESNNGINYWTVTVHSALAGLIIVPTFDATITSDPNAAKIMSTINAAIQVYEANFADQITVNITFAAINSGLGQSLTFGSSISYASFLTALAADSKTTNDVTMLAHLPVGPNNPVNGDSTVRLTTANQRALGINNSPPPGSPDSTISLNMSLMNLDRVTIDPNKYDLLAVVSHEIDEALGLRSALNGLANGAVPPTGPVSTMDLCRYDQFGARSFNTTLASLAYLSIDGGVTHLAQFNQQQGGDFQDFFSTGPHTPEVQDAFGTPGATPNLGVELIALDVSGYDRVTGVLPPKVQTMAKSGNTFSFSWTAVSGKTYQLQYKTNLSQANWLNLGSTILTNTTTVSSSDTGATNKQRFYRVNQLPSFLAQPKAQPQQSSDAPVTAEITYLRPSPGKSK